MLELPLNVLIVAKRIKHVTTVSATFSHAAYIVSAKFPQRVHIKRSSLHLHIKKKVYNLLYKQKSTKINKKHL